MTRAEHYFYLRIGVRIEGMREAIGMSAWAVDQHIGRYKGYTRRVEKGAMRPSPWMYHKIAMAIGVYLSDLVDF